jgi:hypothetical protein
VFPIFVVLLFTVPIFIIPVSVSVSILTALVEFIEIDFVPVVVNEKSFVDVIPDDEIVIPDGNEYEVLLLNVFQSIDDKYPDTVDVACGMDNVVAEPMIFMLPDNDNGDDTVKAPFVNAGSNVVCPFTLSDVV